LSGPPESVERLDALRLPWMPDTTASALRLRLVETEPESSWVGTFAVGVLDHPEGTRLAVSQGGRPFLTGDPVAVDSLRSSRGIDLTTILGSADGELFRGSLGDTVYFTLPALVGKEMTGGGGFGIDGWKEEEGGGKVARGKGTESEEEPAIALEVFHPVSHTWVPLSEYRARDQAATEIIDLDALPQGMSARVRMVWTGPVSIDAVRLFREVAGGVSAQILAPIEAVHSTLGDVRPALLENDAARVPLVRGERVDLLFRVPPVVTGTVRDLVALTRGKYRSLLAGKTSAAKRIPAAFFVNPVRPNPASGVMHVDFGLPKPAPVALRVFDLSGRLVQTVKTGLLPAGYHQLSWDGRTGDGRSAAAGVYFYRLEAGKNQKSGRVVILR